MILSVVSSIQFLKTV